MAIDSGSAGDGTSSLTPRPVEQTAASPDIAETTPFSHVPWPVRPSPGINYDFVSMMYLGGSIIAFFFYVLEKQILAPLLEGDGVGEGKTVSVFNESSAGDSDGTDGDEEPWKEFAKGMEGMYLIFVPFVPCLLWGLVVRYYWMKENKVSQDKKDS